MQRFFLSEEAFHGEVVYFPEDISHQITRVLRLNIGDEVVTIDPLGKEYMVVLTDVNPKICVAQVQEITTAAGEPKTQVDLYIALTQREKFEWVLQKARCALVDENNKPAGSKRNPMISMIERRIAILSIAYKPYFGVFQFFSFACWLFSSCDYKALRLYVEPIGVC